MKQLILASASPRRRELLSNMGAVFEIRASEFDERGFIEKQTELKGYIPPEQQSTMLALEKARYVYENTDITDENVIIGVDTAVVADDVILGKPHDENDAIHMLGLLSGKTHKVISGFALIDGKGKTYTDYDVTLVHMREISEKEARHYVETEYVLDKAGAYAIQGKASMFIKGIEGCYFNVVGLPVYKLAEALKNFDIDLSCGGI